MHIVTTFAKPLDKSYISKAPFNNFLINGMRHYHKVYLAGEKTTDKLNNALFNTDEDNSNGGIY
ncbi:DUF4842 domain-containing protein [Ilyomonas limi]|uniref:DUF4842 domain-containing protein n=1 Tax=Ilyomonas limi TaxID=2575867 RepID=A0A4U3LCV9_9BACT|nr:DUF4842 domain-containing protein [Ilyomonas limi]